MKRNWQLSEAETRWKINKQKCKVAGEVVLKEDGNNS